MTVQFNIDFAQQPCVKPVLNVSTYSDRRIVGLNPYTLEAERSSHSATVSYDR